MKKMFILIVFLTLILSMGCSFASDINDNQNYTAVNTAPVDNNNLTVINTDSNELKDSNSENQLNTNNNEIKDPKSENQLSPNTYEITDDNYDEYFNSEKGDEYGYLLENSTIKDGDVIKIGNVSKKIFFITKSLNITSISDDSLLTDSIIFLREGSEGSNVTNLHFENNAITNSISREMVIAITTLNTGNILIYNNTISSIKNFAMSLINTTNSKIDHNKISTYNPKASAKWGGKSTFLIHSSSNNIISNNEFESSAANCISFKVGLPRHTTNEHRAIKSDNNTIENNTINGTIGKNLAMCWLIFVQNDGANKIGTIFIRNNTIINGNKGIYAPNLVEGTEIINNKIINCENGIEVCNAKVENNTINVDKNAIISSKDTIIKNNNITTPRLGLLIKDTNITILNNNFNITGKDNYAIAIELDKSNITINNNTINTYYGIATRQGNLGNISIINNTINSEKSAIYMTGTLDSIKINENKINVYNNQSTETGIVINGTNNSEINNNIIKTNGEYAIVTEDNITIKNNYLTGNTNLAEDAISQVNENVSDNYPHRIAYNFNTDEKGNIIARIFDNKNNPLSNKTVTYLINGTPSYKTLVTDKDGKVNISDIYGKVNLTVIITGDTSRYIGDKNITFTVKTIRKTEERLATKIVSYDFNQVAVDFYNGERGGYFVAQLLDENNNPLANKLVQVGFNGVAYKLITDSNGLAKLQINLAWAGIYTFAVAFLGDDDYNGSFVVNKITISKKATSLVVPNKRYASSSKSKIITVTLQGQKAVGSGHVNGVGKTVKVTVNGKTYTAKINSKGVATVKVSITKKGTYTVTTRFDGDYGFNSKVTTSKLTIV
ncbi:hypothetical protein BGI41_00765 [Methanobrevibacter sp. 87.7]|uniref:Ig-like domain-containing protein n=1 Tax=Methanobrevibacter sp. 87.7 TaxID=387957 RepID=UPI000B50C3A6|nr:Ig-like domain-containing protein [Methanobrevibacter sp. 87.7]OWT33764.1 hypothetical protein BGI41_00765 [Methanobrevibacter sp. 87.7]